MIKSANVVDADAVVTKNSDRLDGPLQRLRATMFTSANVRKNLVMTDELSKKLEELAMRKGTNVSELMRRALDLYLTVDEAVIKDKMSVGLVKDPNKLDTRIIGL